MNIYIKAIKVFINEYKLIKYAKNNIYDSIETLPIYNWFKCNNGDLSYLYIKRKAEYPKYFKQILYLMHFEFDKMDNSNLRDHAKLAYLKSLHATAETPTEKAKFSNMYRSFEAVLENKANTETKKAKLNDLITMIEEVNNQIGVIDPHKMTTSRFFSLYNRTIEKIEAKNKQHGNN